jgi:hypothetical protein
VTLSLNDTRHKDTQESIKLSAAFLNFMLRIIMLSVVIVNVMAPLEVRKISFNQNLKHFN